MQEYAHFTPNATPFTCIPLPYLGQLGCRTLQARAQTRGHQNGSTGSTGGKKTTFPKNDPGPHGMPKQVVLARFEPVVVPFGPP